jgi:uncharacterized protein
MVSELQYAPILQKYPRNSYILQTKVPPKADPQEFENILLKSLAALQITLEDENYIDLFSFHGINRPEHLKWIMQENGCLQVIRRYQQELKKIRFIGFSTHAMTPLIVEAIETSVFDYVNLHYHFIGCYTSSYSDANYHRHSNLEAILAAQRHDMGVFIISPSDKGGALYEPSRCLVDICMDSVAPSNNDNNQQQDVNLPLGALSPMLFNNLWLWSYQQEAQRLPPIHTLVIGAARPSDIDDHLLAAVYLSQATTCTQSIVVALQQRMDEKCGIERSHLLPLPTAYSNDEGIAVNQLYWLWRIVKAWGMYKFAVQRYQSLENNLKDWDDSKSWEERSKGFNWVPGLPYRPARQTQIMNLLLTRYSLQDTEYLILILQEVHQWLHSGGCYHRGEVPINITSQDAKSWESAYNLQSDIPFPERQKR